MRGAFVHNAFLRGPKFSEPWTMFREAAGRAGIEMTAATSADMALPIGDGGSLRRILGDPDFVIFWDKDVRCAANLELCGMLVMDSSECIAACDDKSLTHLALARAGVPSIETIACPLSFDDYDDTSFLDAAESRFGYPIVVKDCFGSFGEQVHLARNRDDLEALVSGPYRPRILQRFADCGGRDVRVEVVGGRAVAAMARAAPEGDFRSNATIGGSIEAHEPTAEESELAIRACEAVGADFAGVDILVSDGRPVVCEVNSSAHMLNLRNCTGIDVSDIILEHAMRRARR
ncbi:MAG: RimK family alpha-L-glutamate ligase [Thermoplasmata archaeon]|nr:RimK family alpha-L-glutamate ligase [Thermoplasmata archaeon]